MVTRAHRLQCLCAFVSSGFEPGPERLHTPYVRGHPLQQFVRGSYGALSVCFAGGIRGCFGGEGTGHAVQGTLFFYLP